MTKLNLDSEIQEPYHNKIYYLCGYRQDQPASNTCFTSKIQNITASSHRLEGLKKYFTDAPFVPLLWSHKTAMTWTSVQSFLTQEMAHQESQYYTFRRLFGDIIRWYITYMTLYRWEIVSSCFCPFNRRIREILKQ